MERSPICWMKLHSSSYGLYLFGRHTLLVSRVARLGNFQAGALLSYIWPPSIWTVLGFQWMTMTADKGSLLHRVDQGRHLCCLVCRSTCITFILGTSGAQSIHQVGDESIREVLHSATRLVLGAHALCRIHRLALRWIQLDLLGTACLMTSPSSPGLGQAHHLRSPNPHVRRPQSR